MGWLRPLLRRFALEREMDLELRYHFDRLVEDFMRQGMSKDEAARRARMTLGGMEQLKDDARDIRMADRVERLRREFRHAARSLMKSPGFAITSVLTLALGIGANTEIFSLLDQAMFRNLPVKDPSRLVVFHSDGVNPGMDRSSNLKLSFSYPKYKAFRDHDTVFSGVAGRYSTGGSLMYNGGAENVSVELVTGNYFDVMGVRPAAGRLFTPADDQSPMGHPVVVLSYEYWQRRFGGDSSIVGRKVALNGMPMTVVGVSAAGYQGLVRGSSDDVRVPLMMKDLFTPNWKGMDRWNWAWMNVAARIKDGLSLQQAEAGANIFYRQLLQDESAKLTGVYIAQRDEFLKRHLDLEPAAHGLMFALSGTDKTLYELLGMTGVVLLIACVNLAGLLIARTAARQRELAIRLSLGAGRVGVVRQLLVENCILVAAGGIVGLMLAMAMGKPVMHFLFSATADRIFSAMPDLRVLLFAFAICALVVGALSLTPLFQVGRDALAQTLRSESGASASGGQVRFRKFLVVAQFSFCVWLMIAAGLFSRTLSRLREVDLGFRTEHLVTFTIDPAAGGYTGQRAFAVADRIEEALQGMPGVSAVSHADYAALGGGVNIIRLAIEGYEPRKPTDTDVNQITVTPGYLKAMGMDLLTGRDFSQSDVQLKSQALTAIVNQAFAKTFFKGANPVGKYFRSAFGGSDLEIVGMVRNDHYSGPRTEPQPFMYWPGRPAGGVVYYVRTGQPPAAVMTSIRKVVDQQAAGVPISRMRPMSEQLDLVLGTDEQLAKLAMFFGLLATLLAAIGLYGVMSYVVSTRAREIGIRMALGARRDSVIGMVVREACVLVAAGLAVGIPSGLALTALIRSQLYNTSPSDPATIAVAAAIVAAVALCSAMLPARRAATVDPMRALRWD
jgi:predicted permease